MKNLRVALIHDWLVGKFGAENVFTEIIKIFPNSEIFTIIDTVPENERAFLQGRKTHQSFIAKLPFAKKHFRKYLSLMPIAIEQFDLDGFDLVISSSSAVAKGIIPKPNQLHICYINSPIRYGWDLENHYIKESNITGLKKLILKYSMHKMRMWDVTSSHRVDHFISNSSFIKARVLKYYRRDAEVLNPNVDVEYFGEERDESKKSDYFFTIARHVPYKKIDLIVKAFNQMPNRTLVVGGSGDQTEYLKKIAGPNITFTGHIARAEVRQHMQNAKAFLYAALEDFGIVMGESLAAGTPVIAYGVGGSRDIVRDKSEYADATGILFKEQTEESLVEAIKVFCKNEEIFTPENCIASVTHLSAANFRKSFQKIIENQLEASST
ncbi:MAG: glycosyltransferase [Rickettsiales bacterium]|jgi:glycosyltransferase involved in cell wall biosynthesis|nr:glycosyltransferase [Rickettsiales bacterium]